MISSRIATDEVWVGAAGQLRNDIAGARVMCSCLVLLFFLHVVLFCSSSATVDWQHQSRNLEEVVTGSGSGCLKFLEKHCIFEYKFSTRIIALW